MTAEDRSDVDQRWQVTAYENESMSIPVCMSRSSVCSDGLGSEVQQLGFTAGFGSLKGS